MQVKAATNGIDLLQQLMLPKLRVNPLFNEVSLPGGGELQYRINGVKVEIQDVIALQPADIIRIEFHDNPGLRYGNTEAVLDYIVRRPETGGNVGVNLSDALAVGWGNNNVNGRINHKKSEFSFNYGINHRNFHKMWRDNEETFTFADGTTLHRREAGEPGHLRMLWQNLNTAYSYQNDKRMLNATIRYYTNNVPHFDYKGWLYNMEDPAERVRMIDQSSEIFHRPAFDLYYQENLKNNQTLVINLVGTYNYTNNARLYQESLEEALLTDVDNRVIGEKYSWIGEGIYEKKFGENRLGARLKHTQAYTDTATSQR
ncbi:TonB-dependent receptor SusC [termite gut metagenome]|uniref:TonB-dependent receptor SusC n=1 Tax=termite gut metagenome TaxID=433724 RepID=A0A5J4QDQ4_9ZZZZ